jgi:signal transduction histidine kinase
VTGRRTGRRYTIPVGYQRDGERLVILVSRARRKNWWRNYREPGPVEVRLGGCELRGMAWRVHPDSFEFRKNLERTFRRLPWLGRSFGIEYDRRTGLREDQIARLVEDAAMVQIELERPHGPTRDSLGLLAGRIAHDTNNALYVILGRTELALRRPDAGPAVRRDLEEILTATRRATEWNRWLLDWSRGVDAEPSLVDVAEVVRAVVPLVRASLSAPPSIEVAVAPDGDHRIRASSGDLSRVVTHLLRSAVDARGASSPGRPDGGGVAPDVPIEVTIDRVERPRHDPSTGRSTTRSFVRLTVRTGRGREGETGAEVSWPEVPTGGAGAPTSG